MKPGFSFNLFPALAAGFAITSVHAAVGLTNGSFETTGTLYLGALGGLNEASGWSNLSAITNYQASSAVAANPPNGEFTSTPGTANGSRYLRLVADGTNVGVLAQSLGTMSAGETYTISADVFGGPGVVATYGATISLVDTVSATPSVTYASQTVSGVTAGAFTAGAFNFTYTATASDDGDPLVLLLTTPAVAGGQASRGGLDNIQLIVSVPAAQWAFNGNGNWNTPANWSPATVPNAQSAGATLDSFGGTITGPVIATLDVPVTLGTLQFDHSFSYTVAGGNVLTLDNGGSGAAVTVQSGAHTISAPVTMAESLTATVVSNSSLDLAGSLSGGFPLLKNAAGNLILSGNLSGFTGLTTINGGTVTLPRTGDYSLTHSFAGAGRLAITGGGQVTLAPASPNSHGGTDVSNGGTLVVDAAGDLGAGGVGFYNGTLAVGADVTAGTAGWLAGAGGGTVNVASGFTLQGGGLAGTGTMNKTGDGTWRISPGGTGATIGLITVSAGTLDLDLNDAFGNHFASAQDLVIEAGARVTNGTNSTNSGYNAFRNLTLNGGELRVTGTAGPVSAGTFPSYAVKGTVTVGGSVASSITDPGSLANSAINLGNGVDTQTTFAVADVTGSAAADLSISAVLRSFNTTGTGLRKTGAGTLRLTRANTYSGKTSVETGTLILDQTFLANAADIELTTGATLQLDFAGADTIDELFIDGLPKAPGTWGRTGHPTAQNTTGLITGDGLLQVGPPAAYAGWASSFLPAFTNTAADLDFENDGLASGIEWVVGGNPTLNDAASVAPTFDNTTDPNNFLFTYRRRDTANADPNTTIIVQYGSNLTGWTPAQNGVNGVSIDATTDLGGGFHQVTVAIPRALAPSGKLFARLNVAVAP